MGGDSLVKLSYSLSTKFTKTDDEALQFCNYIMEIWRYCRRGCIETRWLNNAGVVVAGCIVIAKHPPTILGKNPVWFRKPLLHKEEVILSG